MGSRYLAKVTLSAIRIAMPRKESRIGTISGLAKLGWIAITTMAHMSWKTSIPSDIRPVVVSIWKFSWNNLTTSSVEEAAITKPM